MNDDELDSFMAINLWDANKGDYGDGEMVERKERSGTVLVVKPWQWRIAVHSMAPRQSECIVIHLKTWDYHVHTIAIDTKIERSEELFKDVLKKIGEYKDEQKEY